jgi:hypothetical protein
VGDTYESIPPAMMQAFKDADASTTGYNRAAASLCDNSLVDSMSLDDIILSCVFHNIETFCPGSQDDDELDTYVKTIDWKLPKVRWHYFSSPPPPPPVSFGAFHDLVAADPEGMELLREMLLDAFPSLTHVASQTYGNPALSNTTLSYNTVFSSGSPPPRSRRAQAPTSVASTAPTGSATDPCTTSRATRCPRPSSRRHTFATRTRSARGSCKRASRACFVSRVKR